jgi:hypothetical protein
MPGDTKYDAALLNRKTTSLSQEHSTSRLRPKCPAEMLTQPGIKLPAIHSVVPLLPHHGQRISKMGPDVLCTSNPGSASYAGQGQDHPPFPPRSHDGNSATSVQKPELLFVTLLAAGSDMKTILEAMDQEISPQDVLNFLRVELARPPMPEEPVSDPDYKPRPSTVTGRAPDALHSRKETERRAQHKHYLDLSELKIPDFFLKLCGWDEPNEAGSKRSPRTKSSVLQAGCLYVWFLSGPVLRCFKGLLHDNRHLEEKVQRLEAENHRLLLRYESLPTEAQVKAEHAEARGGESTLQSPRLKTGDFPLSPSPPAPSLNGFAISQEAGFFGKHDPQLPLPSAISSGAQFKSKKRRTPSVLSQRERSLASPHKRRKTNSDPDKRQDTAMRLTMDDEVENSLPDIASVKDENKDDITPTQMYRLRLSSAPSLQSTTPSCWDIASVLSTSSSWDQPSTS